MSGGLPFSVSLDNKNNRFVSGSHLDNQMCSFTDGKPNVEPEVVYDFKKNTVVQIDAGRETSDYLCKDGTVPACGRNTEGRLGNSDFERTDDEKKHRGCRHVNMGILGNFYQAPY